MEYLKVKGWEKHQHYKGRKPPWIKLYGDVFLDHDFTSLSDLEKLHLLSIWVLARLKDGIIPNDPTWVKKAACLDAEVSLEVFINKGFLIRFQDASNLSPNASNMLATCAQVVSLEEKRREETEKRQRRGEADGEKSEPFQLASEFHFHIPGTRKPVITDLEAEFTAKLDWLKAQGRNDTEHIRKCITDPKRDKTAANTIGKMWQFWKFCGLEDNRNGQQRNGNTAPGGGRNEGLDAPSL